ncbi:MAG TPA: ABC transporter permease [Gemmatimonadaceae bacterium]|nr:ABC transporter permease [Gemmatimonadaceae bacterium]
MNAPRDLIRRLRSVSTRLFAVFRTSRIEDDVDAEVQSHLAMRAELLAARGMPPEQVQREARRLFGNRTYLKEEARNQELFPSVESVVQDIRYGLRLFRRSPGFTTVVVLMLGVGLGLNAAMFSVFDRVLIAPIQLPNADRLYMVTSHARTLGNARRAMSGPDFRDVRAQNTVFTGVAAVIPRFAEVLTGDGQPCVVNCASPTQAFFDVLGVRPLLGRTFLPAEFNDLNNSTLLVSYKFWKDQLGGDPHVIGRVIHVEDGPSVIVGVMPPMPDLYSDVDLWLKLATEPSWDFMNWRANKFLDVVGRLKPGVDPRVAEQELTAILRRADGEPADVAAQLTGLREVVVGPIARQLDIMMAAVALVLLVTLLNTAAMLLAHSIKRAPELAVRLGLGASRARIRRQLLVEGVLLSGAGGVLGLLVGALTIGMIRGFAAASLPRMDGLALNGAAIAVSLAIVVLSSGIFTVIPGTLLKLDLAGAFRGSRTETGRAQRPFGGLIVAEIACAVVLTVCAGLLVRSFMRIQSVPLGYRPEQTATAYLRTNYDNREGYPFWRNVLDAAANVPGATSAALSDCMPSMRVNTAIIKFADRLNVPGREPSTEACWISADYFKSLGVGLVHGRFFTNLDDADRPPVVIINSEGAARLFPGQNPIGKRIGVSYLSLGGRATGEPRMREIVGIVPDLRQRSVDARPGPAVYMPYTQDETYHVLNSMQLYIRGAAADPVSLAESARARIQSLYPNQPVERIRPMREVIAQSIERRTYAALLMTGFAVLALLLCGLGIYGVVSYVMQQRTKEFGIRMALGARRGDVLVDVLKRGGLLVGTGIVLGACLSLFVVGALSQLLFETGSTDPEVYGGTALVLAVTGLLACLVPAIRASRLDPRAALGLQ